MKRKLTAGLTSATLPIFIQDTSSTTGGGLGSLTHSTAGLVCEYRRQGQSTWTAVTLSAGTLGTWSSGGFVADGSLAGAYELGVPDAALATGARWCAIRLRGAANMLPCLIEIELDLVNYQDSVRAGLTALPNAAAGASGGLPTGDASGRVLLQPTQAGVTIPTVSTVTNRVTANTDQIAGQTANAAGAVAFPGTVSSLDAAGVWAHSTRSLTTFGTLINDVVAAVWTAGARTLTAFGFTVDTNPVALSTASGNALVSAVAAQITLDHGSGLYTRNTEPDNTGIASTLAAVNALSIPTAANNAAAVWATTDRTLSAFGFEVTLKSGQKIGLTDGSIAPATFSVPSDVAGPATEPIGWLRRIYQRSYNRRTRNRTTGVVTIFANDNTTPVTTETQSTVGDLDTVTRAV